MNIPARIHPWATIGADKMLSAKSARIAVRFLFTGTRR
jgi:hypothetical protein